MSDRRPEDEGDNDRGGTEFAGEHPDEEEVPTQDQTGGQ